MRGSKKMLTVKNELRRLNWTRSWQLKRLSDRNSKRSKLESRPLRSWRRCDDNEAESGSRSETRAQGHVSVMQPSALLCPSACRTEAKLSFSASFPHLYVNSHC